MFFGHPAALVARDRGQAQGCDPMGVLEGPCGYPAGQAGILGKLSFLGRLWYKSGVGGGRCSDYV